MERNRPTGHSETAVTRALTGYGSIDSPNNPNSLSDGLGSFGIPQQDGNSAFRRDASLVLSRRLNSAAGIAETHLTNCIAYSNGICCSFTDGTVLICPWASRRGDRGIFYGHLCRLVAGEVDWDVPGTTGMFRSTSSQHVADMLVYQKNGEFLLTLTASGLISEAVIETKSARITRQCLIKACRTPRKLYIFGNLLVVYGGSSAVSFVDLELFAELQQEPSVLPLCDWCTPLGMGDSDIAFVSCQGVVHSISVNRGTSEAVEVGRNRETRLKFGSVTRYVLQYKSGKSLSEIPFGHVTDVCRISANNAVIIQQNGFSLYSLVDGCFSVLESFPMPHLGPLVVPSAARVFPGLEFVEFGFSGCQFAGFRYFKRVSQNFEVSEFPVAAAELFVADKQMKFFGIGVLNGSVCASEVESTDNCSICPADPSNTSPAYPSSPILFTQLGGTLFAAHGTSIVPLEPHDLLLGDFGSRLAHPAVSLNTCLPITRLGTAHMRLLCGTDDGTVFVISDGSVVGRVNLPVSSVEAFIEFPGNHAVLVAGLTAFVLNVDEMWVETFPGGSDGCLETIRVSSVAEVAQITYSDGSVAEWRSSETPRELEVSDLHTVYVRSARKPSKAGRNSELLVSGTGHVPGAAGQPQSFGAVVNCGVSIESDRSLRGSGGGGAVGEKVFTALAVCAAIVDTLSALKTDLRREFHPEMEDFSRLCEQLGVAQIYKPEILLEESSKESSEESSKEQLEDLPKEPIAWLQITSKSVSGSARIVSAFPLCSEMPEAQRAAALAVLLSRLWCLATWVAELSTTPHMRVAAQAAELGSAFAQRAARVAGEYSERSMLSLTALAELLVFHEYTISDLSVRFLILCLRSAEADLRADFLSQWQLFVPREEFPKVVSGKRAEYVAKARFALVLWAGLSTAENGRVDDDLCRCLAWILAEFVGSEWVQRLQISVLELVGSLWSRWSNEIPSKMGRSAVFASVVALMSQARSKGLSDLQKACRLFTISATETDIASSVAGACGLLERTESSMEILREALRFVVWLAEFKEQKERKKMTESTVMTELEELVPSLVSSVLICKQRLQKDQQRTDEHEALVDRSVTALAEAFPRRVVRASGCHLVVCWFTGPIGPSGGTNRQLDEQKVDNLIGKVKEQQREEANRQSDNSLTHPTDHQPLHQSSSTSQLVGVVFSTETGNLVHLLQCSEGVLSGSLSDFQISPAGRFVSAVDYKTREVVLWDLRVNSGQTRRGIFGASRVDNSDHALHSYCKWTELGESAHGWVREAEAVFPDQMRLVVGRNRVDNTVETRLFHYMFQDHTRKVKWESGKYFQGEFIVSVAKYIGFGKLMDENDVGVLILPGRYKVELRFASGRIHFGSVGRDDNIALSVVDAADGYTLVTKRVF